MTLAEEENLPNSERMTKDDIAALLLNEVEVRIEGLEKTFGIRPLTWKEDDDIDKAVMSLPFPEAKTDIDRRAARARERMRLVVQSAVVQPRLTKEIVQSMPVGLVIALARAIDDISSFQSKNE
jgi:hypothetical protein